MADDRSLKDIIRFLDPSGGIDDADIAEITGDLKFTEVLDIVSAVGKDDLTTARDVLSKYDQRFTTGLTNEYSNVPVSPKTSGFKPIKPVPTIAPTNSNAPSQNNDEEDVNAILDDPTKQNDPNVKQIKNLLQRMQK